jgi:hypothetical protein
MAPIFAAEPDRADIVLPAAECRAFLAHRRGAELADGQEAAAATVS